MRSLQIALISLVFASASFAQRGGGGHGGGGGHAVGGGGGGRSFGGEVDALLAGAAIAAEQ